MKNVDDALRILVDAIPGLLITSYENTGNDTFSMKLELEGKVVPCEGHVPAFETLMPYSSRRRVRLSTISKEN